MKPVNKLAILLTLPVIALTGCATTPPVIQTVTVTKFITPDIPPGMLACMPAPPVPIITATDAHGGSETADLLVQEYIAGNDCRLHLQAVKEALSK